MEVRVDGYFWVIRPTPQSVWEAHFEAGGTRLKLTEAGRGHASSAHGEVDGDRKPIKWHVRLRIAPEPRHSFVCTDGASTGP
jgi:hypothetical protein